MKYKNWLLLGLMTLGLSGCVGVAPDGKGYTINVPMNMINSTIGQNFPQSQQTNYGTLMIEKPNVLGRAGSDKLGVWTSFTFSNMLMPQGIKGAVSLSSGVRYNSNDRGLYLANPMIDELKFQNFSLSQYLTPQIKNLIGDAIAQQLRAKPIYRMNTGASFVRNVGVQDGNVVVTVGL